MIDLILHHWSSGQYTGLQQLQLDSGSWYRPHVLMLFIFGLQLYDNFAECLLNIFLYLRVVGKGMSRNLLAMLVFYIKGKGEGENQIIFSWHIF